LARLKYISNEVSGDGGVHRFWYHFSWINWMDYLLKVEKLWSEIMENFQY
jgi:hypothetical protein